MWRGAGTNAAKGIVARSSGLKEPVQYHPAHADALRICWKKERMGCRHGIGGAPATGGRAVLSMDS